MTYRPIARIVWEVAELHLDEAEFLAEALDQDLDAHHSTLAEVAAGSEERLLANVDGLVILGPPAVERLLIPAIQEGPPPRAQAAAMARLGAEHDDGLEGLWPMVEAAEGELLTALGRALSLWEGVADQRLAAWLGKGEVRLDAMLLEALALRGADPGPGLAEQLARAETLGGALRAARFADPKISRAAAEAALAGADQAQLHAALLLSAQQALPTALERARQLIAGPGALRRAAMELLATVGNAEDLKRLHAALGDADRCADALWALGFHGGRDAAEAALERLADEALGGLAAEAFIAITGLDPVRERCRGPRAPEAEGLPPLEEDDLDADLIPGPEALLPLLDPRAVQQWWAKNQGRFPRGARYVFGAKLSNESFRAAFDLASTRRRRVHALELAVRTQGRVVIAPRAATARQARQLAAFRS